MNRYLKRVVAAYAMAVLAAFIYPPWRASGAVEGVLMYSFFWDPPGHVQAAVIDHSRILLEVVTLTLVLLLAMVSLWGEENGKRTEDGSCRPRTDDGGGRTES